METRTVDLHLQATVGAGPDLTSHDDEPASPNRLFQWQARKKCKPPLVLLRGQPGRYEEATHGQASSVALVIQTGPTSSEQGDSSTITAGENPFFLGKIT